MSNKKNMLLLSGSKSAVGVAPNQKPGLLDWAEPWIKDFFRPAVKANKPILFVPYARHDAIEESDYFEEVQPRLKAMGIDAICAPPEGITDELLDQVGGIFVGGGHTYTLLHKLQETGSLEVIRRHVENGLPYLGSSAGSVIACPTIKTTNDMGGPKNDIIDTRALGLIGAHINCHYKDKSMENPEHQGETRDTRLKEVSAFNPSMTILGLYEGTALRVEGDKTYLWTSNRSRGLRAPVFRQGELRGKIICDMSASQDVSQICAVRQAPRREV